MSRITQTGTLAPTEMLRLLSSRHVWEIIMRQIVNRSWARTLHSGNHPSCVSGALTVPAVLRSDWRLTGCWCSRMLEAHGSGAQTRSWVGHVSWLRFSSRPHPGRQIKVRWLNLTNQIEMLALYIHAALKLRNWPFLNRSYTTSQLPFAGVMLGTCKHTLIVSKSRVRIERSPVDRSLGDDEQLGMNHHLSSPWEWEGANDVFNPFKAINLGCLEYLYELNSVLAFFVKSVNQQGEILALFNPDKLFGRGDAALKLQY